MAVVWRARAIQDITNIVQYIALDNASAAVMMAKTLSDAGDSLATLPNRGRPGRSPGTRELVITPNYILAYRVSEPETVTILRVWHAKQNR